MDNKKPALPSRSASPTSGEFLGLSERKWRPVRNQKHFRTPFRSRNLRNWRGLERKNGRTEWMVFLKLASATGDIGFWVPGWVS